MVFASSTRRFNSGMSNANLLSSLDCFDLVDMYEGQKPLNQPGVVINTEWGALGNTGSLEIVRTAYDHQIDKNSLNPGKQVCNILLY